MARLRDLVAEFDQPKQRKELEVGQMVKFGIWSKPAEHRIGKIVKISEPGYEVVVDVDGKLIKLNRASKSLVIKPLDAETPDSDSKFSL